MRERGFGIIGYLIGAAVAAALIVGAIVWINHFIAVTWEEPAYKRGTDDQRAADSNVLEQVKTERDEAKRDLGTAKDNVQHCLDAAKSQSDQVAAWRARAEANAVEARRLRVQADQERQAAAPRIADLQAKAAAAPKLMACTEELAKAKEVLRDALRIRRQPPVLPAPKVEK